MSQQENYRVTKITTDPPTHNDYTTLQAALNSNQPAIDSSPLDVFLLEWTVALPSTNEYTVKYGFEAWGNPQQSPQMIRLFTEDPPGENHLLHDNDWPTLVSYIEGIDAEHHN